MSLYTESLMPRADKPSAYVLFCDDVRQELGDKRTFVGVYGPELHVPAFPALIPKFYVVTTLICYYRCLPKNLIVRLTLDGQQIGGAGLEEKEIKAWAELEK